MDAIAAYNKLMDAEEALVEVVGLDGLRRHRRRRDVVDEDARLRQALLGLDDDLDDLDARSARVRGVPPPSTASAPFVDNAPAEPGLGAGSAVSIGAHSTGPLY